MTDNQKRDRLYRQYSRGVITKPELEEGLRRIRRGV